MIPKDTLPLNTHLLSTEDVSHLFTIDGNLKVNKLVAFVGNLDVARECNIINYHLYLVSDEPIKDGEWCLYDDGIIKEVLKYSEDTSLKQYHKKIILTTDPKLIADGVPAIDGNTKAKIQLEEDGGNDWINEVNFLTEFCKRFNNQKVGFVERFGNSKIFRLKDENQKDTKKVDVDARLSDLMKIISTYAHYKSGTETMNCALAINHYIENQALQSTGQYSLEDMIAFGKFRDNYYNEERPTISIEDMLEEFQSLTLQPKGEIVIEVEMEDYVRPTKYEWERYGEEPKIKLKDGQPTLIFK